MQKLTSEVAGLIPAPVIEARIVKRVFSSVPIISEAQLREEYSELGEALNDMTELHDEDEWKIEKPVYYAACFIAVELIGEFGPGSPSIQPWTQVSGLQLDARDNQPIPHNQRGQDFCPHFFA